MSTKSYYAVWGDGHRKVLVRFSDYASYRDAMNTARKLRASSETYRKRLVRVSRDEAACLYNFRHREPTSDTLEDLGLVGVCVWEQ